jgi:hypothetical protein
MSTELGTTIVGAIVQNQEGRSVMRQGHTLGNQITNKGLPKPIAKDLVADVGFHLCANLHFLWNWPLRHNLIIEGFARDNQACSEEAAVCSDAYNQRNTLSGLQFRVLDNGI